MLILEVLQGQPAGRVFEIGSDACTIGRAPSNDVVIEDMHVSGEHARIVVGPEKTTIVDLRSTNGTAVVRGGERLSLGAETPSAELASGDVVELGSGESITQLRVTLGEEGDGSLFVSVKRLDEVEPAAAKIEQDPGRLSALYASQKRIGAATDLDRVLIEVSDAALALVPGATHVTVVLRDDEQEPDTMAAAFVPVMTRVRLPNGSGGPPAGPGADLAQRLPQGREGARGGARGRRAHRGGGDRVADGRLDPQHHRGAALEGGGDPGRAAGRQPQRAGDAEARATSSCLLVLASNASLAVANARLIKRSGRGGAAPEGEQLPQGARGEAPRRRQARSRSSARASAMQKLIAQLDKVVDTRVTVLIEGETGTGKELIAAAVHYRSRRRDKLFVAQNCAALAESLLESELFGHKKGSFTGANEEKKGLFEIADGGTLFLDEITETPLSLQSKLLRALQEGEIRPVGATTPKHVNVRIVAATNRNLEEEVKRGRFREDLYYRLKVFPLRLPPLRERREDIPVLATAVLLERYAAEIGKPWAASRSRRWS
jgi:hypothetical protein